MWAPRIVPSPPLRAAAWLIVAASCSRTVPPPSATSPSNHSDLSVPPVVPEPPPNRARSRQPEAPPPGHVTFDNVTRSEYAGSSACSGCHPDVVAAWERSPMHRMTRDLPGAEVHAPFDGSRFRFKQDTAVFERRGEERFIRLDAPGAASREYRVTRVIGGRTREDFVGVDAAHGAYEGVEVVLPVSFMLATRRFRVKGYSVMVHERPALRAGPVWSQTCIFCHNTIPEIDRLLGAFAGERAEAYQGQQVDRFLPASRRARAKITDSGAFATAVSDELSRWSAPGAPLEDPRVLARDPAALAREAIGVLRSSFAGADLVETGIGCEACHGGARAHAARPSLRPSFVPASPWLRIEAPAGPAQAANRVCARCHQVLFSRYPFTWEGGRRSADAGGSHISSGEGRDFLLGGCAGAMTCTSCHDPHAGSDPAALRRLATPAGNPTCTRCHRDLAADSALRAHSHHDPSGTAGSCVACHMPRKNMGLDGTLTRYHRIGSPTDPARVLGDRPLECALCHADRSVHALADAMQAWWPVRYPAQRLEELYGSLDANVMAATLARGKPHEQAVAAAVLGEARARDAAPALAPLLLSETPLLREWALRALQQMTPGCDVDLAADDASIAAQAATCGAGSPPVTGRPHAVADEPVED